MSVWVDFGSGGNSVRAGRVNSSGTPLDKPRLRVADAASSSAVSWNGSAYVLAWTTSRPAAGGGTEYVVQTRRMAQDATLGPIVDVATSASSLSQVTAASVGATTLIAWVSGGDIRGARVDGSGNVLDPAGIMICGVAGSQTNPNVGASDTQFLVAWSDSRTGTTVQDIYAARVGVDGTVLDPGGGAVSAAVDYQYGPHVGSDGSRFLVSWTDWRNSNSDVYGARVSSTAAVADPSGIAIRTTADPEIAGGVSESGGADVPTFIATWHQESAGGTTSSAGAVDISS
jgi:hypothetical protein